MQANKNIYLCQEKSIHLQVIPQQSTQITANLPLITDLREKPVNFFIVQHGHQL